jgi:hypothetical protein
MLLVALAIRLDSKGPVLFKQKRYGFNNELIEVFKFRSMYHAASDADARSLSPRATRASPASAVSSASTSLDELPQFFNVLRGELSLVGPRPHATKAKAADQLYERRGRWLFRPPSRQARHHRLGADQRLARRDRYRRESSSAASNMTFTISRTGRSPSISTSCGARPSRS